MVGKRESKTEVDSDYFKYMKQNNISLAKALTEERLTCKQYLEERILLQKKLDEALLLNIRYESILNKLLVESKETVPACTVMLSKIQQFLKLCSEGVNLPKVINCEARDKPILPSLNSKRSASPVVNKTHAVKPMVSGHVIFRPTINLWRLSDTDHAELTRNLESPSAELTETTSTLNSNGIANRPANLAVPGLQPNIYDADVTDPESLVDQDEAGLEETLMNGRIEGLVTVHEEPDAEIDETLSQFTLREAIVVIDPLSAIRTPSLEKKKNKTNRDDPLEGPSTLLDDSGHFTSPSSNYVSKPRVASSQYSLVTKLKRSENYCSDSSSDEELEVVRSRIVSKRKAPPNKDKDGLSNNKNGGDLSKRPPKKKKTKNGQTASPQINTELYYSQPVVLLTREDLSMHESTATNDSMENQNITARPRRNKLKGSFKEQSLRSKMRREK